MSLQRLATIAEIGSLVAALGAHGAVLAFCLADHAAGATAVGNFAAEILRPVQLSILSLWLEGFTTRDARCDRRGIHEKCPDARRRRVKRV